MSANKVTGQDWVWLNSQLILAVHDEQLAEHGGLSGLLESELARPEHLATYAEPDVAELAASYGYGIARNHPFIDGNKRTAFVAALLFLAFNYYNLQASNTDKIMVMLKADAGEITETEFATWIRSHSKPN